jgi:hypothetical protein
LVICCSFCAKIIICRHHSVKKNVFILMQYSLRGKLSQVLENMHNISYYSTVLYGAVEYIQYIPQAIHNNITLITKRTCEVNSHNGPFTEKICTQDRYHGTRTLERTSLSYVQSRIMMSSIPESLDTYFT